MRWVPGPSLGSPSPAQGPCTHHQTLEELGHLRELVALGTLVAVDGPHQHGYGREEALLQGVVLGSDSGARGQVGEREYRRGGRAGGPLSQVAAGPLLMGGQQRPPAGAAQAPGWGPPV